MVSVEQLDAVSVIWRFSAPVVSVEDFSGLLIANQEPDALQELTSEGALIVLYSNGVSGDDPWSVDVFPPVALVFAEGFGPLIVPESGTVIPIPP